MNEMYRRMRRGHLADSEIRRKGTRSAKWYDRLDYDRAKGIFVSANAGIDEDAVAIRFTIPAGGQGDSTVEISIKPQDFRTILAMMSATDREATLRAMAEEMRYQICTNPKR